MKHKLTFNAMLVLALFLTLAPIAFASTTWYVSGANGNDTNNCKSPTTACKTIGHAISLAASGDSIMVAAATYRGNLTISKSLNLIGSSAQTTIIDGGGFTRGVTISNSAARVTLSQLTIRHGSAQNGGGVYNSGTLTISNSTVSGNAVRGSFHFPSSYGGGIYNDHGTLTINNSTISANSAFAGYCHPGSCAAIGGGIFNFGGAVAINNSTLSGNSASFRACATFCSSSGGGISSGGTLTINNSTLSGNAANGVGTGSASGGGIYASATVTISNSTLSGNTANRVGAGSALGGGIYAGGTVVLQNTIVADNGGGDCYFYSTVTSKGYNMSSDTTCKFSNSGDRNNIDPKLGTLGNYGGPTQTIPLLTGSPAIDAGNPSGCTDGSGHLLTKDQRGYLRHDPEDTGGCDMGAYEKQSD